MKVTLNCSAKGFEKANYILEEALANLRDRDSVREMLKLSELDVLEATRFRKKLASAFIKSHKKQTNGNHSSKKH